MNQSAVARLAERVRHHPGRQPGGARPASFLGMAAVRGRRDDAVLAYRAMRASFLAPKTSFGRLEERAAHEGPLLTFAHEPAGLVARLHEETLAMLVRDGFAVLPSHLPRRL